MTYTYESLPAYDNLNRFSFAIDVHDSMFIRKGKMIAYYGNLRFEALGSGVFDMLVQHAFNAPLYVNDFVIVTGQGKLVLGDNYNDINSYDLDNGALTVKSNHVLGFDKNLECKESMLKGYLTLLGTGRFLASSNGPVLFLEPPCRVDEQALLGWADVPSPYYHHDYSYIKSVASAVGSMMGLTSTGEERQVDFAGTGNVLVQSTELGLLGQSALSDILARMTGLHQNELQQLQAAVAARLGMTR
jgi:uncharacterized protein (AIM24 family)